MLVGKHKIKVKILRFDALFMASAAKMKANRLVQLAEIPWAWANPCPINVLAHLSHRPSWVVHDHQRSSACPASRGCEC